jgi:hypothetical protein
MDTIDRSTHVFVIKVWRERLVEDEERYSWRGHITHLGSGEQRQLKDFATMFAFIRGYLRQLGIEEAD